jgi:hypothetical protein
MAESTDLTWYHARALEDLAEVLHLCDRPDEEKPVLAQAVELYEEKGIAVLAERVRRREPALRA